MNTQGNDVITTAWITKFVGPSSRPTKMARELTARAKAAAMANVAGTF